MNELILQSVRDVPFGAHPIYSSPYLNQIPQKTMKTLFIIVCLSLLRNVDTQLLDPVKGHVSKGPRNFKNVLSLF